MGLGGGRGALTLSTPYRTSKETPWLLVTWSPTQQMGDLTVHYPNWGTSESEANGLNDGLGVTGINQDSLQQTGTDALER